MKDHEIWIGSRPFRPHEVEIDRHTIAAFWRLGQRLALGGPRDQEVFALGRCIGGTPDTGGAIEALDERDDPAGAPMSRLVYGGDSPMFDAYWQSPDNPVVFQLARKVFESESAGFEEGSAHAAGSLIFDLSDNHARLAGLRIRRRA